MIRMGAPPVLPASADRARGQLRARAPRRLTANVRGRGRFLAGAPRPPARRLESSRAMRPASASASLARQGGPGPRQRGGGRGRAPPRAWPTAARAALDRRRSAPRACADQERRRRRRHARPARCAALHRIAGLELDPRDPARPPAPRSTNRSRTRVSPSSSMVTCIGPSVEGGDVHDRSARARTAAGRDGGDDEPAPAAGGGLVSEAHAIRGS